MSNPLLILCLVMIIVVFQYLMEVHVGGSTCIYDAESGASFIDCTPQKSTPSQFLGLAAPLQLSALGLPLLVENFFTGAVLIFLALLLFFLFRGSAVISTSPITS